MKSLHDWRAAWAARRSRIPHPALAVAGSPEHRALIGATSDPDDEQLKRLLRDVIDAGAPAATKRVADFEFAALRAGVAAMQADTTTDDPDEWDAIFLAGIGVAR